MSWINESEGKLEKLVLDLENCYGIRKLSTEFDFSNKSVYAIYAPNGVMKSSLAQTFRDIADGTDSCDRIFPARACKRRVEDEKGAALPKESVLVIRPYDETFGHTEKTSTLLVNQKLREEYEALSADIDQAKGALLKALKEQSHSKKDLEREVSTAFTTGEDEFFTALIRIKDELAQQQDAPLADIHYDLIFDEKVVGFLGTKDFKTAIEAYVKKYNELLAASTYFKKGIFNYYNASQIAKTLEEHGFFGANHSVNLNADERLEIKSKKDLEKLIQKEKDGITNDADLKAKFVEIEKLINKNVTLRDFDAYLSNHEEILPQLENLPKFKENLWKSYLKARYDLYKEVVDKYQAAQKRMKQIEEEAEKQRTDWERVIDIFNARFSVPFKLFAKNRVSVMLGHKKMITLGFTFEEGGDSVSIEKDALMRVLSTGERKALYILNVIFEVEARKKAGQETVFVADDVADSFDYKNKYAIIQYLKEIAEDNLFKEIILTHNFDFFRTINSRFVSYDHCLMAVKSPAEITLVPAAGIQNVFVKDWKGNFFNDARKRIASIPFIRNIIEYTKGENDPAFVRLTSLLHWKADTEAITQGELDSIFAAVFGGQGHWPNQGARVTDSIFQEADACLQAAQGLNMENKIVLSIGTRLLAERYMTGKINDAAFVASIKANQTWRLLSKFSELFPQKAKEIEVLQRVHLMTPENIHVNAFMYEPILDMSDDHLRRLYQEVKALS